ncbi:MAG: LacI family DNA-binding transcriptional regulator [Opitutaceae bacterium]|jgi:LacI family transcriptional regulator|nr:LacI family DNA-binding transcriptional regulator [Opitutaceae bacterium]
MEKYARITIKGMAAQLGVSHTTVSLALRNHASLPKATKDRIRDFAKKAGYHPDPMLGSLVAYRQRNSPQSFKGALAWLTNYPTRNGWKRPSTSGYFAGARQRAEELGYRLDEIWLQEPDMDSKRIRQILVSRTIRGLLFAPQPAPNTRIDLNLDGFAAATFGYSLVSFRLPVVMNHQFRNMMLLVQQLASGGIQKIGLAMPLANDERVYHNYAAGFWAGTHFSPKSRTVKAAPLHLPKTLEKGPFLQWFEKYRPEVVIAEAGYADQVLGHLKEASFPVPDEVGIALVNIPYGNKYYAGIDENHELIGATAVDVVSDMSRHDETGENDQSKHVLIDGVWKPGKSIRLPAGNV